VEAEVFGFARVLCLSASLNRSLGGSPLGPNKVRDDGRHGRFEADHVNHAAVVRVGEGEPAGGEGQSDCLAADHPLVTGL
jgi:hypothetical protein